MSLPLRALTAIALTVALMTDAAAADSWPTKPMRLVVPFTPGGGNDFFARLIGARLSPIVGQQVIVDNRPGAGGTIGADIVAKAPPDGYTLLMGSVSTVSINPHLYPNLPFDPLRDFAPIALFATTPQALTVHPSVPAKTVAELIALAKAKPGTINFASAGNATSHQLGAELFKRMAGIDIVHVPYKGSAPAVTGMLSGEAQMMFSDIPAVITMVKAEKLRGLAVTAPHRSPALPDLPTIAESGLPGFEVSVWYGLIAPAKTPAEIVDRLNQAMRTIGDIPEVKAQLAHEGAEVAVGSPADFDALIRRELARWGEVIKDANIRID